MLFANLLLYFHALLCIMTSQGFPYQKSWCDMSDIRAIKLSETRAIIQRDDTQRYTACLKRDTFERDIGRDMSDNECDDTPAIHSVCRDIFE
jgi:uncharacterized membrane protein YobD (UPF0266 family)